MRISPLLRLISASIRRTLRRTLRRARSGIDTRTFLRSRWPSRGRIIGWSKRVWPRIKQGLLPNLCALCGNMSHKTLCDGCDAAYWNEARLRCTVCAFPLTGPSRRAGAARYQCAACRAESPPFDATFALADYRAPLDALALGLKFRARLMLA